MDDRCSRLSLFACKFTFVMIVVIVAKLHYSAVGMAGDSADASLLTSAIEEDPTEIPDVEYPERSEAHPYHLRIEDSPRKRKKNQNATLLSDFDDIIDYIDCCSLSQNWLSRICSKFDPRFFLS